jgi:DNA-binding transcriptional LysR family regulator
MDNPQERRRFVTRWENLPELEAVRVFAAVAQLRSFRGAANALGVPRSTVGRRLSTLEGSLGLRLLHRTTRHVSLTNAGEIFLAEVTPALVRIGDARQRMLAAKGEPSGLVRLTATPATAPWVVAVMLDLLRRYPRVRVELDFTDRVLDLVAEGYDLALRAGKLDDSTLIARPIGQSQSGYYASPAYLQRRRLTLPDQLVEHELVVFSGSRRGLRWPFQIGKKLVEIPVNGRVVLNNLAMVQLAARRGYGITWLPAPLARDDLRRGSLVPVLRQFWPPPVPVQLVYPSARHLSPQVRVAIDLLAARFKSLLR